MSLTQTSHRHSERGFTLVELAIVMVIIGLLIGGILKGQELIANAKISATVSQLKGLDAALNTFQDKYNALAGDMTSPETRLPGCTTSLPCGKAGNGNGRYGNTAGDAPSADDEGVRAFPQLSQADLISGINTSQTESSPSFGGYLPAVKAGGGMWLGASSGTGTATGFTGLSANRSYATLNGTAAAVADGSGGFTPSVAAQIDRKIDDGVANAGSVQSACNASGISGAVYQENVANSACAMVVRVLN